MPKKQQIALTEVDDMLAGFRARITAINDILLLEEMDEEGVGTGVIRADEVAAMGRALAAVISDMQARFYPQAVETHEAEATLAEPANDTAPGAAPEGVVRGKRSGRGARVWTDEQRAAQRNRMIAMQQRKRLAKAA